MGVGRGVGVVGGVKGLGKGVGERGGGGWAFKGGRVGTC